MLKVDYLNELENLLVEILSEICHLYLHLRKLVDMFPSSFRHQQSKGGNVGVQLGGPGSLHPCPFQQKDESNLFISKRAFSLD